MCDLVLLKAAQITGSLRHAIAARKPEKNEIFGLQKQAAVVGILKITATVRQKINFPATQCCLLRTCL